MQSLDTLSLEQIDAMMADLRVQRKTLQSSRKASQQKIVTLARRRERLLAQVQAIDEQIEQLGREHSGLVSPAPTQRRRRAQVAQCFEAILDCVRRHVVTKRATIMTECHLSPANASIYLRQLCQEGRLLRQGEKSGATYSLP